MVMMRMMMLPTRMRIIVEYHPTGRTVSMSMLGKQRTEDILRST